MNNHIAHNTLGNPCPECDQPMALSIIFNAGWHPKHRHVTGAVIWMECKRCNMAQSGAKYVTSYDPAGLRLIERGVDDDE